MQRWVLFLMRAKSNFMQKKPTVRWHCDLVATCLTSSLRDCFSTWHLTGANRAGAHWPLPFPHCVQTQGINSVTAHTCPSHRRLQQERHFRGTWSKWGYQLGKMLQYCQIILGKPSLRGTKRKASPIGYLTSQDFQILGLWYNWLS